VKPRGPRTDFKLSPLAPDGFKVWLPDGSSVSITGKLTGEQARYFRSAVVDAFCAGRASKAREISAALREGYP
jgi:hypothetical protein